MSITGPSSRPDSSIHVVPVISPAPFSAYQPANAGSFSVARPRGRTAVTPVRTGPWPTWRSPSPRMIVLWPTATPWTSVIALSGPGVPSNGTPRSRARGFPPATAASRMATSNVMKPATKDTEREACAQAPMNRLWICLGCDDRRHLRLRAHRAQPLPAPLRAGGHPDRRGRRSRRACRRGIPAAVRHSARPLRRGASRRRTASSTSRGAASRSSPERTSRPSRTGASSASTPSSRPPRAAGHGRRWRPTSPPARDG